MDRSGAIRNRILEDLVSGALAFGARITIDELAGRYGGSHMPVREALRQLAGEGIVEMEPGRGARVRRMDAGFVENLFTTRCALEVMLARGAALNANAALADRLDAIEAGLEAHIATGDFAAVLHANRHFHETLFRAAGNPQALALVDPHWVLLHALWRRVGYGKERFAGVASDHRHMIRAVRARDAEAVGILMGAHVIKAKYELLSRMDTAAKLAA
jgi:DNA-binding GntR family transcriptional regulator